MNRVLLLMTTQTYRAGAFLEATRRVGASAVVGSERPQALAGFHPDGHWTLPFGDPEVATAMVLERARERPISAVIATDDDGVVLASRVARSLGLRASPPEAVETARDKHLTRQALERAGQPGPWFRVRPIDGDPVQMAAETRFPCVLKPRRLGASRGVLRADDPVAFVEAFGRIARLLRTIGNGPGPGVGGRTLLVEEYLPGREVALEGLLSGGCLEVLALFDKPDPLEGPTFEETLYVTPSRLPVPTVRSVVEATASAIAAIGLTEGPVHAELRVSERGPRVLEIAPRSIGGLCSRALRFEGGQSLEEILVRHALGNPVTPRREDQASGVMMIPIPRAGRLVGVSGEASARRVPGVEEIRITIPLGDELVPLPEGNRYLGFLFARAETPEDVESSLREAHRRLSFEVEASAGGVDAMGARATCQDPGSAAERE